MEKVSIEWIQFTFETLHITCYSKVNIWKHGLSLSPHISHSEVEVCWSIPPYWCGSHTSASGQCRLSWHASACGCRMLEGCLVPAETYTAEIRFSWWPWKSLEHHTASLLENHLQLVGATVTWSLTMTVAIYENCWNEPWSLDRCQDQGQLTEWCWGTCDHHQWGGMTKEWKRECRSALDCCYEFPLLLWIHPLVCSGLLYHFGTSSEELRTLWKLVFKTILINHFQHMYSIVISRYSLALYINK